MTASEAEPGDMYTSVFVYTVDGERDFSNPARGPTDLPDWLLTVRSLVKKGNEIQRCWRLYEPCRRATSNGSDLLIRYVTVSSIWYP